MFIHFRPRNHRHSSTWDRFEIVYYRDIRQNFAKCLSCSSIVSYKKTTGTASLIRHKCKLSKAQQTPIKQESLIHLLTQSKTPPTLTPAPVFDAASSTAVSSTVAIKQPTVKAPRSDNPNLLEIAAKNLAYAQVQWLCQSLTSSEIVSDPSYLSFLQSLVNFGSDFGKQNISNVINRNMICHQMLPQRYETMQLDLMQAIKDAEFSISFHKWSSLRDEQYVTVVGYYFTGDFDYKNHILGTRKYEQHTGDVMDVVREITDGIKAVHDVKIKCVGECFGDDFEWFPCVVSQISKVIEGVMNSSSENKIFFRKIHNLAHEILGISEKVPFEKTSTEQRVKILFELHQHGTAINDYQADSLIKRFTQLLGSLFSAISNLTATTDHGERCVTLNKVYLWFKKLLKLYGSLKGEDDNALSIFKAIEQIKLPEVYQIAVFLDPNFKSLKFLEANERVLLLDSVKRNLQRLINDENELQPPAKKQRTLKSPESSNLTETFLEFMDIHMESIDDQVNSEIQCYMGFKLENPIDIVDFWRDNECFPYLKKLARNILNLPSCTFHSNCCFLGAGNELYLKFQNLPAEEIEMMTFLHQNI